MLRISKKVEYALLACKYLADETKEKSSVNEISDFLNVSYEFLAKTLQKLSKSGISQSFQGVSGGYKLLKPPSEINLFEIISAIEGDSAIVKCIGRNGETCNGNKNCALQTPMALLQCKFEDLLKNTMLSEMI